MIESACTRDPVPWHRYAVDARAPNPAAWIGPTGQARTNPGCTRQTPWTQIKMDPRPRTWLTGKTSHDGNTTALNDRVTDCADGVVDACTDDDDAHNSTLVFHVRVPQTIGLTTRNNLH